ncbi:MAG: class I SAM-dependent methyltransferase [Candidatus Nanohalobium sp.]
MEDHILDGEKASKLEDESRFKYLSKEELLGDINSQDTVVEVGSGTGFYTDYIAKKAGKSYAVDFQEEMHDFYRDKGVPENIELVNSKASNIDIEEADTIVSLFSFHEIDVEKALKKFSQILEEDGKLVIYDWSSEGETDEGPPKEKRFNADSASEKLENFFDVKFAEERYDTFKVVAKP